MLCVLIGFFSPNIREQWLSKFSEIFGFLLTRKEQPPCRHSSICRRIQNACGVEGGLHTCVHVLAMHAGCTGTCHVQHQQCQALEATFTATKWVCRWLVRIAEPKSPSLSSCATMEKNKTKENKTNKTLTCTTKSKRNNSLCRQVLGEILFGESAEFLTLTAWSLS